MGTEQSTKRKIELDDNGPAAAVAQSLNTMLTSIWLGFDFALLMRGCVWPRWLRGARCGRGGGSGGGGDGHGGGDSGGEEDGHGGGDGGGGGGRRRRRRADHQKGTPAFEPVTC